MLIMCWAQGHPAGQSLRPIWNLNSSSFTQSVRGQETCNGLPTRLGEDVVGGDPSLPGSANQEPVRSSRSLLPASWVRVGGRGAGGGGGEPVLTGMGGSGVWVQAGCRARAGCRHSSNERLSPPVHILLGPNFPPQSYFSFLICQF